jgi:hypothetical protein
LTKIKRLAGQAVGKERLDAQAVRGGILDFRERLRCIQASPARSGFGNRLSAQNVGCRIQASLERLNNRRISSPVGVSNQIPLNSALARFAISATAIASNSLRKVASTITLWPVRKAASACPSGAL